MFTSLLLASTATAFNAGILIHKTRKGRYTDTLVDLTVAATLTAMFAGTMGGQVIAMIASFIVSVYLLFYPVQLPTIKRSTVVDLVMILAGITALTVIIVVANIYSVAILSLFL